MAQSAHLHQDSTEDHAPGAPPQQEAHHELEGESIHSNASIDIQPQDKDSTTLSHIPTHASHTHDAAIQHHSSHVEIPDESTTACLRLARWSSSHCSPSVVS